MVRVVVMLACIGVAAAATATQRPAPPSNAQAVLRSDLDGMTARLGGGRATSRQVVADAERLVAGYRSLGPLVRTFGPGDFALNRDVGRRSLSWLARAGALHAGDPVVARAFLGAYDAIGGFYRDRRHFYVPGAYVAYAGAARLAQRLAFARGDYTGFERELERYALAYGTLAALNGTFIPQWTTFQDLPESAPPPSDPPPPLTPLPLPAIDVATLSPTQRDAWSDVRVRFRSVASSVHGARVVLEELSVRLRQEGLSLNPATAATALKMQASLEDASDLIQTGEFEAVVEALRRADYQRGMLRSVTGQ
jgi:hypothetical protein